MKKYKLIIVQILIATVLVCTSVYATVNTTISVDPSSATVERGQTVTVTLSIKDVDSSKKVESVEGYINYNKDVIEPITVDSIQKSSSNTVTIGSETLKVEDLTNKSVDSISLTSAYVAFNGNPSSNNDSRIVIDFENGLSSNTDLLKIDFKVKSNATLGTISQAISYSMFVITAGSEESNEITENIQLTVQGNEPAPTEEKVLSEITITSAPAKTIYTEGESFNTSGMVVTAKYSDGTTKNVTNYTVSPNGSLSTSNSYVTIRYEEGNVSKQVTQAITVQAAAQNTNKTTNSTVNNTTSDTVSNNTTNKTTNSTVSNKTTNSTTTNKTTNTTKSNSTSNVDNSTTTKTIPSTGAKIVLLPILTLIILAYISYNKYVKYKDI